MIRWIAAAGFALLLVTSAQAMTPAPIAQPMTCSRKSRSAADRVKHGSTGFA